MSTYTQGAATLYPGLCSSALTARTAYVIRFYVGQKGWIEIVFLYYTKDLLSQLRKIKKNVIFATHNRDIY